MHARPKFFAKVMGELLFWVGEDKMPVRQRLRASGTPKWQIEGFVDWEIPEDECSRLRRRSPPSTKKKILGLNAAKLYDIEVPGRAAAADADERAGRSRTTARRRGRRVSR